MLASDEFRDRWGHVKISTPFLGGVAGGSAWLSNRDYDEKHPVSFQPYPDSDENARNAPTCLGYDIGTTAAVAENTSWLEVAVQNVQKRVQNGIFGCFQHGRQVVIVVHTL